MGSLLSGSKLRQSSVVMSLDRYISSDHTSTVATGGTELIQKFALTQSVTSNVTASGTGNTTFTLNKTGIWLVDIALRVSFSTNPSSGDIYFYAYIVSGLVGVNGQTVPFPIYNSAIPQSRTIRAFSSGDQIQTRLRNGTNQVAKIDNPGPGTLDELGHISLTYLQSL